MVIDAGNRSAVFSAADTGYAVLQCSHNRRTKRWDKTPLTADAKRGRHKIFTDDYINEVFNDFVLNNTDSLITPTTLSKWSEHNKWKQRWQDGGIKPIPRPIWYQDKWKAKMEQYNKLPFIFRADQIDKVAPFNVKGIINKHWSNKKDLIRVLEGFEERANIALKIAVDGEKFKLGNINLKEEIKVLKEKSLQLKAKMEFYKNECEELVFDSHSISERAKKGIKENALSSPSKKSLNLLMN